jgi:uncharacterized NAD-dependent epimerase/dehydratase family protein
VNTIDIRSPYLIFLGSETEVTYTKTGAGLVQWRPELCRGQIRLPGGLVDLGVPNLTIDEAVDAGIQSLLIGTAAVGGGIPEDWLVMLEAAAAAGLDIVAGVHTRLNDIDRLKQAAASSGARLVDVRVPPEGLPVGTGKKRSGKRVLTVGTDCAVGKKYTALAIERDMKAAGLKATFRASGQTGIMIAGSGIPIDAVVADFLSGAAEQLSPDNDADHWDVIEGQGGIFHPGYASVTMGLLIGSQPDAFVVCTEAGRTHIEGWGEFELPSIEAVISRVSGIGKQVNPTIRCAGISVNTSKLPVDEREDYLRALSQETGLPCIDPIAGDTQPIIERLIEG